jgi:septal ring factor EnvC (AmiA/AmiB activator)
MMNSLWKAVLTFLGVAVLLVGWGVTWANQSAQICANRSDIAALHREVASVSDQATESEKAIVRMETKIEYIIKGVDEIKAEVKSQK